MDSKNSNHVSAKAPNGEVTSKQGLTGLLGITAALLIAGAAGYLYNEQSVRIVELESEVSKLSIATKSESDLLNVEPQNALEQIRTNDSLHPVVKAGYLRFHKPFYLGEYESKIDNLLNQHEGLYPDYGLIQSLLFEAKELYPDSHKLRILEGNITSNKHETLESITLQINTRLEKAEYLPTDQERSVFDLYSDLGKIHSDFVFSPSTKASDTFGANLDQALKAKDTIALSALISIGNQFFNNTPVHQDDLATSNSIKEAVVAMNHYSESIDTKAPLPYPNEAARVLYKEEFEGLSFRLNRAKTVGELDKITRDIDRLAAVLPTGFEDINDVRFKTANKYLQFSDILFSKKNVKSARKAMQKANSLMKTIESTKQS